MNLSVVPTSCRGARQKFFRFEADFIAGRVREEAFLTACSSLVPSRTEAPHFCVEKGILDAESPSSFWIVADMFHLSKVLYGTLCVRFERTFSLGVLLLTGKSRFYHGERIFLAGSIRC